MLKPVLLIVSIIAATTAYTQEEESDSSQILTEVVVTGFEQNRRSTHAAIAVQKIGLSNSDRYNKTSLVNSFNSIAGLRMEERSPSSYRINIRGSSLRSPFGVRNVKVYWNQLALTDPGGNTYFNQLAFNNFSSIEVFKGPVSSMYGAGTGGLLLVNSLEQPWIPGATIEVITGSYSLANIFATVKTGGDKNRTLITYAHNEHDGYREHSRMTKDNVSLVSEFSVSQKQSLRAAVLYNNLYYQTPGGLTLAEYTANPKSARPAAGSFPSAADAKAAIYQKNFLAGLTHTFRFNDQFINQTSISGAFAEIRNPTFRNYERRNEPGFSGRTVFKLDKGINDSRLVLVAGGEIQEGFFNTQVSKNLNGNPDTLLTDDDSRYSNKSVFLQADGEISKRWVLTAGISINRSDISVTRLNKFPVIKQERTYSSEWAPRIAILRRFGSNSSVYATASKGFSPPTIGEVLPSTGVISTFLEAEEGINYEVGSKVSALDGRLYLEVAAFYFKLNDALVARKDSNNADYYVNAGDTKQQGIEFTANYLIYHPASRSFFTLVRGNLAYTYNNFEYGDYKKESTDLSGKKLPGIPMHSLSILFDVECRIGFYFNSTFYYSAKSWLNDANTVSAGSYTLVGSRLGWKDKAGRLFHNFYIGVDNILDEKYSLGNDINAAGGRYYNAAPTRNFYLGVSLGLTSKKK